MIFEHFIAMLETFKSIPTLNCHIIVHAYMDNSACIANLERNSFGEASPAPHSTAAILCKCIQLPSACMSWE
jgi:hypothetical protein